MKFGRRLIRRVNFTLRRQIHGRPIKIPFVGGIKVGVSAERFLLDILEQFLPKLDGAVLDVGANLGQTLCKVKVADPHRAYFGFEPNAACHAYLETLVRLNGWSDVTVFPCGLGDNTSILRLHVSADRPTDPLGSLLPSFFPDGKREIELSWAKPAVVFRYADIADTIGTRIAFLKIDVEGAELEVARGMSEAISRDQPVVVIELIPDRTLVRRHEETVALFRSLDYDFFAVRKHANKHWAGVQPMDCYAFPEDRSMTDYLAIPTSKRALLDVVP